MFPRSNVPSVAKAFEFCARAVRTARGSSAQLSSSTASTPFTPSNCRSRTTTIAAPPFSTPPRCRPWIDPLEEVPG